MNMTDMTNVYRAFKDTKDLFWAIKAARTT